MENRNAAYKAVILQVGVKYRQRLRKEQALVDNGPARHRTDIEIAYLRSDDLLFDPAADKIQVLLKFCCVDLIGHWPSNHDLFNLRPRCLCLVADDGHIDRYLTPTINCVARVDDLRLNNRPAILLCAQVSARQEYHADRKPVRHWSVAAVRNRIVEKADGQIDMQSCAIAGLAICINCAAMPYRLQRLNTRRNNAARRLAICRRDQANAAGIAFGLRMIHAFARKAFMFGGRIKYGHAACLSRLAFDFR